MGEGPGFTVPVTRPIAVRQLAAGLATAAAVLAAGGLGLSLDTVEYGGSDVGPSDSITRLAWGERVSSTIADGFQYPSWRWGGPLVLAVVVLAAVAGWALLAAPPAAPRPWAAAGPPPRRPRPLGAAGPAPRDRWRRADGGPRGRALGGRCGGRLGEGPRRGA